MNKKGISPVVATVLLISLTLVMAGIIVVWARAFVGESVQKNNQPIAVSCGEISFDADVSPDGEVDIVNRGSIPIYDVELRISGEGTLRSQKAMGGTIPSGDTGTFTSNSISRGTEVLIVPIILGEVGGEPKQYTCEDTYGVSVVVS